MNRFCKIGLALGGGGARGLAHLGILRELEQEPIPVREENGDLLVAPEPASSETPLLRCAVKVASNVGVGGSASASSWARVSFALPTWYSSVAWR